MEEYNKKKWSYNKKLFWTLQGSKTTLNMLKSKIIVKEQVKISIFLPNRRRTIVREEIESTSMAKTFWKQRQNILKRSSAILKSQNRLLKRQNINAGSG